jgi:hypothetical protein
VRSAEGKTDLVGYFWSGLQGRAVKGLCLVTLFYADERGLRVPVNFRVVDKAEGKTKNALFREMVEEVLGWGLRPAMVSADSWYSGVENLKFLRKKGLGFLIGLEKNRIVSERPHEYVALETLALPESGQVLHLREFGFVTVFRTLDKNHAVRHYAQYDPQKKAHEGGPGFLPPRASPALGHRVLPSCPQAALPCRGVLCALEARPPQPRLLCAACFPAIGGQTLTRSDRLLV